MDHRSLNCIGRISSQQHRNGVDASDTSSGKRRPHSWHSSTQTLCRLGTYPCGARPPHKLLRISLVLFPRYSPQSSFREPRPCFVLQYLYRSYFSDCYGNIQECEISCSHADEYEGAVFWDVVPCRLVDSDRRLRWTYYLNHQESS
jgi:hypothetical protein